ncbi:N-acetyltransferase [Embleya sp. NBC_00896]|uniref:N-acetyltransferase n=1 Tax=Embleya sp. NBC_00896 TaxID=2975961 RepID=UPI00386F92C9|nr:N-acetyltransferase [Embleya sp. NBC_00896]
MPDSTFVPDSFVVPPPPSTPSFRLEPLAARHNAADLAAWSSSIEHIRATPGFADRHWPPAEGMPAADNLRDLVRHADDFARRTGFTYTVLDPKSDAKSNGKSDGKSDSEGDDGTAEGDVIGCVYIYPDRDDPAVTQVRSWVRADRAELDEPLYREVSAWLAECWPFTNVRYASR